MKKLIAVAVAVAGGAFLFKKRRSAKAETDLWAEATNSPDLR